MLTLTALAIACTVGLVLMAFGLAALFVVDAVRNGRQEREPRGYKGRHVAPRRRPAPVPVPVLDGADLAIGDGWAALISAEWRTVAPQWTGAAA